jgi:hypothetical protein
MLVNASPNHSIDRSAHALDYWSYQASRSATRVGTLLPRQSVISIRWEAQRTWNGKA